MASFRIGSSPGCAQQEHDLYLLTTGNTFLLNTFGSGLNWIGTAPWPDSTPHERLTMHSTNSLRMSHGTPSSPLCEPYLSLDQYSRMSTGNQKPSIYLPGLGKATP
ncbi:hypothetical protein BST61_g2253 [Cercospora zeina]